MIVPLYVQRMKEIEPVKELYEKANYNVERTLKLYEQQDYETAEQEAQEKRFNKLF